MHTTYLCTLRPSSSSWPLQALRVHSPFLQLDSHECISHPHSFFSSPILELASSSPQHLCISFRRRLLRWETHVYLISGQRTTQPCRAPLPWLVYSSLQSSKWYSVQPRVSAVEESRFHPKGQLPVLRMRGQLQFQTLMSLHIPKILECRARPPLEWMAVICEIWVR